MEKAPSSYKNFFKNIFSKKAIVSPLSDISQTVPTEDFSVISQDTHHINDNNLNNDNNHSIGQLRAKHRLHLEREMIDEKIEEHIKNLEKAELCVFIREDVIFNHQQIFNILKNKDYLRNFFEYEDSKKFFANHRVQIQDIVREGLFELCDLLDEKSLKGYQFKAEDIEKINNVRTLSLWLYVYKKNFYDEEKDYDKIYESYQIAQKALKKIEDNQSIDLIHAKACLKDYSSSLKELQSKTILAQTLELAKRAKDIDMQKYNAVCVDTRHLPEEAKSHLNTINCLLAELDEHRNALSIENILNMDNMKDKRMPQVINEYLAIPERYRKILKGNPDNPERILEDSLQEIIYHLSAMTDEVHGQSIDKMKKTNLYLKRKNI